MDCKILFLNLLLAPQINARVICILENADERQACKANLAFLIDTHNNNDEHSNNFRYFEQIQ